MSTEIANMMPFMTEQFLLIKSNMREATLLKTMTRNDNHQIIYLREENKSKTIINHC